MKEVTSYMYNNYGLKEMKCDFMGYTFKRKEDLSFHHLIIPNREGGPIAVWNGSILNGFTSHPYLHRIESRDEEIFYLITRSCSIVVSYDTILNEKKGATAFYV